MKFFAVAGIAVLSLPCALAETPCPGTTIHGVVYDGTHALIPGATVTLDGGRSETSGQDGQFLFGCVAGGRHRFSATAAGFAKQELSLVAPHASALEMVLQPEKVEIDVEVNGDEAAGTSATASGPTQTIAGKQLQSLADDPDDLLRELQQMAAAGGGNPSSITIAVDGFQGASTLPPKDSIAYIKVNPDEFSAEYREPPFGGGRVEVYTKPGQSTYHGALFATNGSPWENARDPFSTNKASIGKQRYGFELTGPIRKKGSDFLLTLEHRSIDNFAVVNAVTLDTAGNTVNTVANVATPQRLWIGTARLDWQLGAKNTVIAGYDANVNYRQNVGVGGTVLADTGYDSSPYEHVLRLSDVTTASAHLMHEARVSLRWDGERDTPVSNAPQIQVSGAFTGGGTALGPQRLHEFNVEVDDDAILTTKNHTFKFGTQLMMFHEHQRLPTSFNGTYTFGGGSAPALDANGHVIPGTMEAISGLEQYRRALLGLPGGVATAFNNVVGTPEMAFTLVQDASFFQDDWNVGHGVHVASGLRYSLQNNPTTLNSITPRLGILWSPTQKGTWTLHAHVGTFADRYDKGIESEVQREDGVARVTSTIYNPVFGDPFAGATPIHSVRRYSPHITSMTWFAYNVGGTRSLPYGWNVTLDFDMGRFWNYARSPNINSPENNSPMGPRPGASNLNVLEMQNSGQGNFNAVFAGIEQHTMKHLQLSMGAVRVILIDDTDDNPFFSPQNSLSNLGELAHRSNQPTWHIFGNGMVTFPKKLQLSNDFYANAEGHYNITTGFDNNGDGNFNDRPQYAAPGTPNAIQTRYGLLVSSGGTGVFPRNQGVMPWKIYLDMNLQRTFPLTRNKKAAHPQVLTLNVRSANVLNHMNVTQVGGVLGSPLFGVPFAADNGRRIEAGVRYSF